jgi:small-conductance mechanosensitive channel/CRP-like cAMP-binding protein
VFQEQPLLFSSIGDVRERVFGRELSYLLFASYLALIVLLVRSFDSFIFDFMAARRRNITAPLLLRQIVSIVLYLVSIAWAISEVFQYHVTALLTTTTVVAAVIGLALQDTLGNLFAGISLHMEDSFGVGDVVRSGEFIGVVEGVNWRATRLRGFNGQIVVLPNSALGRERLEVFPRTNLNGRVISVGVSYDVAPGDVIPTLQKAISNVEGVAKEIPCVVRVGGFGDSAVQYEVKYWTRTYHLRDSIDAEIRRAIWYALRRRGMSIPFPIRSIQVMPEQKSKTALGETDVLARIAGVDLLAPLSTDEQRTLAAGTRVHVYGRGETIIRHGDAGDSMFIIDSGTVGVRVPDTGGPREIAQLTSGSVFGEMALLTGESRTADVIALSDSVVLEIDKSTLQPLLRNNPELATNISEKVVQRRGHLAESVQQSDADQKKTLMQRIRSYFAL